MEENGCDTRRDVGDRRVRAALAEFVRAAAPQLPLPGEGHTRRRFEALAEWSARDLSLGRLAEGHADALSILCEAGQAFPATPSSYGVWAAAEGAVRREPWRHQWGAGGAFRAPSPTAQAVSSSIVPW